MAEEPTPEETAEGDGFDEDAYKRQAEALTRITSLAGAPSPDEEPADDGVEGEPIVDDGDEGDASD